MNFDIIQAGRRWIQPDGTPTPEFFRFIANLFKQGGSGNPPNFTELVAEAFTHSRSNPDNERRIGNLENAALSSSSAGRIAALERRVADLEQLLTPKVNLDPMKQQLDQLNAIVLGSR